MRGYDSHVLESARLSTKSCQAHDSIARLEVCHSIAHRLDHTRGIDAKYLGPSLDHHPVVKAVDIDPVKGNGSVADADLIRSRSWVVGLGNLEGPALLGGHVLPDKPAAAVVWRGHLDGAMRVCLEGQIGYLAGNGKLRREQKRGFVEQGKEDEGDGFGPSCLRVVDISLRAPESGSVE